MGSIHFPSNPRANNVYTLNNKVWWYDGMSWVGRDRGLADPYPLDNLTATANVAYGCRLLTKTYYGQPLVQIRRASDNSNTIFYAVNGVNANIASWISGTTGYVVVWYDQSGQGLNIIQSTYNNQPRWNVNCQNGQAGIDFIAANNMSLTSNASSTLNMANTSWSVYHAGMYYGTEGNGYGIIASYVTNLGVNGWALAVDKNGGNGGTYGGFLGSTIIGSTGLNIKDSVWKSLYTLANNNTGIVSFYSNTQTKGTASGVINTNPPGAGFSLSIGPSSDQLGGTVGEVIYFVGNATSQLSVVDMSQINSSGLYYWGAN